MKQRYKPFLQSLIDMNTRQLNELTGKELRSAYKAAAASLRGRLKGFKEAGELGAVPEKYRNVPKIGSFETEAEMRQALKDQLAYIQGEVSYIKGYERVMSRRAQSVASKLGLNFKSNADWKKFGYFMGDMEARLKKMWGATSDFAVDLYKQSQRLNLDPVQLMRNYEYWRDHLEDLEAVNPIEGRHVTPSDYIKKAKLESITDYYKKPESDRLTSSEIKKRRRKKRR